MPFPPAAATATATTAWWLARAPATVTAPRPPLTYTVAHPFARPRTPSACTTPRTPGCRRDRDEHLPPARCHGRPRPQPAGDHPGHLPGQVQGVRSRWKCSRQQTADSRRPGLQESFAEVARSSTSSSRPRPRPRAWLPAPILITQHSRGYGQRDPKATTQWPMHHASMSEQKHISVFCMGASASPFGIRLQMHMNRLQSPD
jgi:hypothetical protein